jgi:CheY-like chemotaxis protein
MDERELPLRKGHGYALFVDDDKTILTMGSQMLKRLGFKVVSTSNSIEALELFRREPERFRLVLTDQTMPNLMGTELARELYRIRPDIPIILCTGFSELIDEEKAKTMGLQGFLMKPIVASQLSRVIQKALNRK